MKTVVCFDIGGTGVKYALMQGENILDKGSFKTDVENGNNVLNSMCEVIEKYTKDHKVDGVSVSSPGFVDNKTGQILSGNIIQGFSGLNMREYFEEKFSLPLAIENDANCATIAEHGMGNAKGYENVACVTVGTGIGGGLIINDKIYAGNHHMAGEFGFMFINGIHTDKPENEILSDYASTRSLVEKTSKALNEELDGIEIYKRAAAGDEVCAKKISDLYDSLAMGIYNICYTVDPDAVVIGGAISQQEELIDEVKKRISALTPSFSVDLCDNVYIDRCKYLNDAGVVGAYCNFINTFGE